MVLNSLKLTYGKGRKSFYLQHWYLYGSHKKYRVPSFVKSNYVVPFHLKLSSILEQLPKVFILTLRILSLIVTYQYKFEVHLVWSLSLYYSLIQQCFLLTPVMLSVKFLLLGHLNPKKVGEGVNLTPLSICKFSKNVSSKQRLKPCVFVTFNIIISYIFPENFIELPQVVQNI